MTESHRIYDALNQSERDALNHLRQRASGGHVPVDLAWPLAVLLAVLVVQICLDTSTALLLAPVGVVIVYFWNSYRQHVNEVAVTTSALFKIAEAFERQGNGKKG
jgi:hypothetical protein